MSSADEAANGTEPRRVLGVDWKRTLSALTVRDYAWYFTGNVAFFTAMQMNMVLRGYLAYDLTNAATALGILALSFAGPMLFAAPIGGVIADRVDKRKLLMVLQSCVAATILVVTILILADAVQFWHLLVASVVTAAIQSIIMPARQSLTPQLVPQHMLMNAVSLQMGTMNLTRIIGPALAGFLIAPFGIGIAYAVTVGMFVLAVITMLPLPKHGMKSARAQASSFREDLTGGIRFVAARPLFRLLIGSALMMPLFAFPLQQLLPVFQEEVFERGPGALGMLMAATGVGGLVGAVMATTAEQFERKGFLMFLGGVSMGVGYCIFALTPSFWFALAVLAAASIGRMLFQITNNTTIQVLVPDEYRGRVMSLLMMSFGTMPLGVLPVSLAADAIGARYAVAIHAVIGIAALSGLYLVASRLRELKISALSEAELSPSQAAKLVADGTLTQEEANRMTGRDASGAALSIDDVESAPANEPGRTGAEPVRGGALSGRRGEESGG